MQLLLSSVDFFYLTSFLFFDTLKRDPVLRLLCFSLFNFSCLLFLFQYATVLKWLSMNNCQQYGRRSARILNLYDSNTLFQRRESDQIPKHCVAVLRCAWLYVWDFTIKQQLQTLWATISTCFSFFPSLSIYLSFSLSVSLPFIAYMFFRCIHMHCHIDMIIVWWNSNIHEREPNWRSKRKISTKEINEIKEKQRFNIRVVVVCALSVWRKWDET